MGSILATRDLPIPIGYIFPLDDGSDTRTIGLLVKSDRIAIEKKGLM